MSDPCREAFERYMEEASSGEWREVLDEMQIHIRWKCWQAAWNHRDAEVAVFREALEEFSMPLAFGGPKNTNDYIRGFNAALRLVATEATQALAAVPVRVERGEKQPPEVK